MERNNSIARFSCKRRFYLMGGESTLFCLGNRWSGYSPLCVGMSMFICTQSSTPKVNKQKQAVLQPLYQRL